VTLRDKSLRKEPSNANPLSGFHHSLQGSRNHTAEPYMQLLSASGQSWTQKMGRSS
jgi:hypothetical protein